jgi:hypothetical protein
LFDEPMRVGHHRTLADGQDVIVLVSGHLTVAAKRIVDELRVEHPGLGLLNAGALAIVLLGSLCGAATFGAPGWFGFFGVISTISSSLQCSRIFAKSASSTALGTDAAASEKSRATRSASEYKGLLEYDQMASSLAGSTPRCSAPPAVWAMQ